MEKQITVRNEFGNEIGGTFSRRAKQLVNSRRAVWLDETHTAIRLISPGSKEDTNMDKEAYIKDAPPNGGYTVADLYEADDLYDKNKLLKLARKRVYEKKKLKRHILIYISLSFLGFLLAARGGLDGGFYVGCVLTWGIFLLRHIKEYFSPNGSILGIFARSYHDPVEAEFIKLKSMGPERIAAEYKRL